MHRRLFPVALCLLIVWLAVSVSPVSVAAAPDSPAEFVPGELLVKFAPGLRGQDIADVLREGGGKIKRTIPGEDVQVVAVPPGLEKARLAVYQRNPNVAFVELNGIYRADSMPNDPRVGEQWQYENTGQTGGTADADIDAFAAWDVTRGSQNVAIAIVDTGIDEGHADLAGKVVRSVNFTNSSTVQDRYGHGTHVAGIVAATTDNGLGVAGTCPSCVLYNVKVLGDDGSGSWSNIAAGINWALDNGAKVINLSLGGTSGSYAIQSAIANAWTKGVVIVAAAGNSNTSKAFYPAYYSNAIAVAATNNKDQKASFSNYGSWVDVAAPGESILSTTMNSTYGIMSGTSMAAPEVSGLAGLLWSTGYGTSASSVRSRLESTADPISGTGSRWANGRINACKAVGGRCDQPSTGLSVTIDSPAVGATVAGLVGISATASDDNGVTQVEFFVDGASIGVDSDGGDGWGITWDSSAVGDGSHALTATATNTASQTTTSAAVTVTVDNVNELPRATFTVACNGLSCAFDASASTDPDGSISSYDWAFGDGSSGSGVTTNHAYSATGSFTATLTVTDNRGATAATSQSVGVTVPAATMHVGDLDGSYSRFWIWASATVSARVEASDGSAVANATVNGTYRQGGWSKRVTCTTGTSGVCTLPSGTLPSGTATTTFTVDSVSHATLTYDATANGDPDGDSNGTTITIGR